MEKLEELYVGLVEFYLEQKKPEKALKVVDLFLDGPKKVEVLERILGVCINEGWFQEALEAAEEPLKDEDWERIVRALAEKGALVAQDVAKEILKRELSAEEWEAVVRANLRKGKLSLVLSIVQRYLQRELTEEEWVEGLAKYVEDGLHKIKEAAKLIPSTKRSKVFAGLLKRAIEKGEYLVAEEIAKGFLHRDLTDAEIEATLVGCIRNNKPWVARELAKKLPLRLQKKYLELL
jgi:uncharacterized protein YqeY